VLAARRFEEAAVAISPSYRPAGGQPLLLQRQTHRFAVIVRVGGEIDLATHMDLRTVLLEACEAAEPPSPVVLDLSEVDFLASVGLAELLRCHHWANRRCTPLRVVASQRRVLRPIQITGLDRTLDIYPSVEAALRPA
jgi:anti-sigma B factor antagonist